MLKFILFTWSITFAANVFSQNAQTISYDAVLTTGATLLKNHTAGLLVSILKGSANGTVIYSERHSVKTDSAAAYHIRVGGGQALSGKFDSIIWSDGIFYLKIISDTGKQGNFSMTQNVLMRIPPDLNNEYEEGTVNSTDHPDWGEWHFANNRKKRPRLVTVDLSTSYANLAYPANTYPVYRHYEWCDPDRDGTGNSFSISYSEHTNNNFRENTTQLGEVKLYAAPFQELTISSTTNEISVSISKPVPVTNLGETYAIRGPWKFIYYIEW